MLLSDKQSIMYRQSPRGCSVLFRSPHLLHCCWNICARKQSNEFQNQGYMLMKGIHLQYGALNTSPFTIYEKRSLCYCIMHAFQELFLNTYTLSQATDVVCVYIWLSCKPCCENTRLSAHKEPETGDTNLEICHQIASF